MTALRTFIAIDLPEELKEQLANVSAVLKEKANKLPIRWVPIENIHLTIKFLGDVSEANIDMIDATIKSEAGQQEPFEISVGNLGVYPKVNRPRVIWVGVEAPDGLFTIQRRIEIETAHLGYSKDSKKYSPHLTLGRVARKATSLEVREISSWLSAEKVGFLGAVRVDEIHLILSKFHPDGMLYKKISSSPLGRVK